MKQIGIVAHSCEGGNLCYLTACRHGSYRLGPHMHPNVILSSIPMGLSMKAWNEDDYTIISSHLLEGINQVAKGGADFFICPDNTAHLVLDKFIDKAVIPGLHIADVVCSTIKLNGWNRVGLLGTKWTITGSVYDERLKQYGFEKFIPFHSDVEKINDHIFDELCQGEFNTSTINYFVDVINDLKEQGAECVILGCTEIPLIISNKNSPLPVLDSTRLLAKLSVEYAIESNKLESVAGWVSPKEITKLIISDKV